MKKEDVSIAMKWKRLYRKLRRPFEWFGIALALAILPSLSRKGVIRLAHGLADIGYLFDRYGKKVARANLRLMFGSRLTPRREAALIRRSYRNMARVLINVVWMSRNTRKRLADQVSFNPSVLKTLLDNLPAITISGHLGNWEILSQACVAQGVPMMSIAKQIGSKEMTKRLIRLRSTIGQQLVPAEGALRPMLYALKHGTSLGLLVDQHTNIEEGGTWVTLFGVPAEMSMAPAALARKTKTTLIFAWSRPLKDGGFITWDNQEIVAVSKPNITAKEAVEFYILVESTLPQGFSSDPDVETLSDGRISIKGCAD